MKRAKNGFPRLAAKLWVLYPATATPTPRAPEELTPSRKRPIHSVQLDEESKLSSGKKSEALEKTKEYVDKDEETLQQKASLLPSGEP